MTTKEKFEVKVGEELRTVYVHHPTPRVEADANMYASKVFSKLAKNPKDGLLIRAKLDDFLRDQGLYTEDDITNISNLSEKIENLESKLVAGGIKKSEGKKIAIDLRRCRILLLTLLAKRMEYDANTIEHHSERARTNYIISKCLCYEEGVPVFKDPDDYQYDETGIKELLVEPIRRIGSLCSSYDPEYESKLIENKFLKKYGFCNDKFDLVNENGELVDENGRRVDAEGNLLEEKDKPEPKPTDVGEFLED
jgi:hypothetical protein